MDFSSALDYLFQALAFFVFVALGYAIRLIAIRLDAYLSVKIGYEKYNRFKQEAETIVRHLEQHPAFRDLDGEKKKEIAVNLLFGFATKAKIDVSFETVDQTIEAAYAAWKAVRGAKSEA